MGKMSENDFPIYANSVEVFASNPYGHPWVVEIQNSSALCEWSLSR
jgi:hypothetical protein